MLVVMTAIVCFANVFVANGAFVVADDAGFRTAMAGAIRAAANRALPSVVTIEIIGAAGAASGEVEQDAPTSGIVIDEEGFILGSSIVVRRPSASILVVLADGSRHAAKVVSRDHHRDLVLLKIETEKTLTPAVLPSEVEKRIGQTTIAVGRYGSDATPIVSSGVLSAIDRLDGIALQTDARVSPAFYGGPLVDLRGNVLGVLVPAVAKGGAPDATSWYDSGIAFAIPSGVIARKLDRLRQGEDIKKGLIGIVSKSKDPYENTTEIAAVRARSPAETAGIKAGDRVVTIAGTDVRRHQEIRQVLGSYDAGEAIKILLQRDGKTREVEVTLAESIPPLQPRRLGVIAVEQETDDPDKTEVLIDGIIPESAAEKVLKAGDVLLKIGETEIKDTESFRRLMISAEPDKELKLVIRRGDSQEEAKVIPDAVAGELLEGIPPNWLEPKLDAWPVEKLQLPDVSNVAAVTAPKDAEGLDRLGLLVLLLNPGQGSPQEVLGKWASVAQQAGVVVCAVAPADNARWQPKEMDVITRFATAAMKKSPVDESAVAVAAAGALSDGKAEAADSMALAMAVSQSSTFFGAAVSAEARPPAVRVRENQASASLQLLLPIKPADELPAWTAPLVSAGYPIVRGGDLDREAVLRWVRLLQSI